jgi:hypothetical protein
LAAGSIAIGQSTDNEKKLVRDSSDKDNNRLIHVYDNTQLYYLEKNANFKVALPVINTYVPEGVITVAINKYGNDLYSITGLKSASNEEVYQVCMIKNGVPDRIMMNEGGVVFIDINKIRTEQ